MLAWLSLLLLAFLEHAGLLVLFFMFELFGCVGLFVQQQVLQLPIFRLFFKVFIVGKWPAIAAIRNPSALALCQTKWYLFGFQVFQTA